MLVQDQQFQFYSLFWIDGKKITRFRRRASHSKIKTYDESNCKETVERIILDFSLSGEENFWKSKFLEFFCWERGKTGKSRCRRPKDRIWLLLSRTIYWKLFLNKLLKVGWYSCLVFSRVENWYWDVRTIRETRCNFFGERHENFNLNSSTRKLSMMGTRGPFEWGNTSWQIGTMRYRLSRRNMTSTLRHWKRWNRVRIISGIEIIRESDEWSSAKKTETNFKCYRRWRETFYDLGDVHECNNGISSIHGKELPQQLSIHHEHNRSHTQKNVRQNNKIGVRARWDPWIGDNWLGKSFIETSVIDCRWKSHQSSAHEGLRLFGFCIVSW